MSSILNWKEALNDLSLHHDDPTVFAKSEWQTSDHSSYIYVIYRWIVTLFFIINLVLSILNDRFPDLEEDRAKWLIYLTHWGYMVLTLQSILGTIIVTYWHMSKEDSGIINRIFRTYKLYWAMNTISIDYAFAISIVYWSQVYPESEDSPDYVNVMMHGFNSVMIIIDIFVVAFPFRMLHIYLPVIFGISYSVFSIVYFLVGGTNELGDHCIYPIIDWKKPGKAAFVCLGMTILIIALHALTYGLFKLRKFIHRKIYSSDHVATANDLI